MFLSAHLQQFGRLGVKRWCFDVLEEQSADPLPQPHQIGCLNLPGHQVHLPVDQLQHVPGQRTLVLLSNEDKNNQPT